MRGADFENHDAGILATPAVFGPQGLKFTKPVTIVLEFDPARLPAGKDASSIVIYTAPDGTTDYEALTTVVRDATHVAADTTHFSVFLPAIPPEPVVRDAGVEPQPEPDAGTCEKRLCGFYGPGTCGAQADGCGAALDCGTCPPTSADAGTTPPPDASAPPPNDGGVCQNPLTCGNHGPNACGSFDDGCNGKLDCQAGCGAPDGGPPPPPPPQDKEGCGLSSDGGAPPPNDGGACMPRPISCGPNDCTKMDDGCGMVIECNAGCGGSSDAGPPPPSDAGGPCVSASCAQQGTNCGAVSDGCGGVLQCGECIAPDVCGGDGKRNVCGSGAPPPPPPSSDGGADAGAP